MNIKKAGEYSNFLANSIKKLQMFALGATDYGYTVEEVHKRSIIEGKEDETERVDHSYEYNIDPISIANLISELIDEKAKVTQAISDAKVNNLVAWDNGDGNISLDTAIEYAKNLRRLAKSNDRIYDPCPTEGLLQALSIDKSMKADRRGTGKMVNVEGNQVDFNYEVEINKKIDYNLAEAKKMYRDIIAKADKVSNAIDLLMSADIVDLNPKYDIYLSLHDIVDQFVADRS